MGVTTLYLPGNHDARPAFRANLLDWEENDEVIDQVLWLGGLRVIALDSTVPGAPHGLLDEAQLSWLARELETRAPEGTILALHHPPIPGPSEFLNEITLHEPQRLSAVLLGSDVQMIVAGHAHHASAGAIVGIPVWVATATAYQIDVLAAATTSLRGVPGSAFTRIDVTAGGAVATYIPLAMPERLVYDIDFATIRSWIANGGASAQEQEDAFRVAAVQE
jgi:3',5'-cyclic AMP phosphodiesterase CpdA